MIGIVLGVFTISLGAKAFTPSGLPLTGTKNLTGRTAKVIGVVCVLLGVAFILEGAIGTMQIVAMFTGSKP